MRGFLNGRKAGDVVLLSGTVFTGRDEVHKYLHKGGDLPVLHAEVADSSKSRLAEVLTSAG